MYGKDRQPRKLNSQNRVFLVQNIHDLRYYLFVTYRAISSIVLLLGKLEHTDKASCSLPLLVEVLARMPIYGLGFLAVNHEVFYIRSIANNKGHDGKLSGNNICIYACNRFLEGCESRGTVFSNQSRYSVEVKHNWSAGPKTQSSKKYTHMHA